MTQDPNSINHKIDFFSQLVGKFIYLFNQKFCLKGLKNIFLKFQKRIKHLMENKIHEKNIARLGIEPQKCKMSWFATWCLSPLDHEISFRIVENMYQKNLIANVVCCIQCCDICCLLFVGCFMLYFDVMTYVETLDSLYMMKKIP